MKRDVHVVVVNYHSVDLLEGCLRSLLEQPVTTVTIYDNASGAAEVDAVRTLAGLDGRITLYEGGENVGFGAGVNRATEFASASASATGRDVLWVLNPDTVVRPRAVERLLMALEEGEADIVSPLIVTGSTDRVWFAGGRIDYRHGVTWHWDAEVGGSDGMIPTGFVSGAAPMMLLSTWRRLGGFRQDFFLYWEDADFCSRALDAGLRLAVVPGAMVWHAQGGSSDEAAGNSLAYYYYGQRNRVVFCRRGTTVPGLLLGRGLRETTRLLVKPLLHEEVGRLSKARASLRGLVAGVRGEVGRGPY